MLEWALKIRFCYDLVTILGKKQTSGLLDKCFGVALKMLFGYVITPRRVIEDIGYQ